MCKRECNIKVFFQHILLLFCNFWIISLKQHSQTFCLLNSFDIKMNGMQVNKQNIFIFNCSYLFWILYCYALFNYSLFIKSRCSSRNQMLNQHRQCLKISYAVSGCNSFLVNSSVSILTFFQRASSFTCHFQQWVFFATKIVDMYWMAVFRSELVNLWQRAQMGDLIIWTRILIINISWTTDSISPSNRFWWQQKHEKL